MHELSIAVGLVELAESELRRLGDVRVVALHLRLGALAGVVESALRFSFEIATAGTAIEGARLDIEHDGDASSTLELTALEIMDHANTNC